MLPTNAATPPWTGARIFNAVLTALIVILFLATVSVARVFGQDTASDASGERTQKTPWDGDFRAGPLVIDPQVRIETEWRHSQLVPGDYDERGLRLAGKRVGIDGKVGKRLAFEISAELTAKHPWRDVKAQYELPASVTVTGGQFKVPLGLDGTRNAIERDFVFRSRLAEAFSMGRDQGVAVEANFWRKRVSFEAGSFTGSGGASTGDGDIFRQRAKLTAATGLTHVARGTVSPFERTKTILEDLRVGISAARSELNEGRSDLSLRSVAGEDLTSPTYWARGSRQRVGVDVRWRPGPFSASAEFLAIADERRGQGNHDENLTPLTGRGWYAEGTWLVTGEQKSKNVRPRRPVHHGGPGAMEVVLRTERAALGTPGVALVQAGSPRADRPAGSHLRAFTTGLNWYPAAGARLQFNVTRETLGGASTSELQRVTRVTTSVIRLQLFL